MGGSHRTVVRGDEAVAAAALGGVQGFVGAVQEGELVFVTVPAGDADGAGLPVRDDAAETVEPSERGGGIGREEENGELFAAPAGEEAGTVQGLVPGRGGGLEQLVPRWWPWVSL
jgi:hypothetical protein